MTKLALNNLEELVRETQDGSIMDRAMALGAAAMMARILKEIGEIDLDSYIRLCGLFEVAETRIRKEMAL